MRGSRVQNVVSELRSEKIDIVPWSPDMARFACSALAPAEVSRVYVDNEEESMEVIVPDDQLSLAIGKKGQNVRLAARLLGWKIDIKSESRAAELAEEAPGEDEAVSAEVSAAAAEDAGHFVEDGRPASEPADEESVSADAAGEEESDSRPE
jgi:N utilization substance protein A